MSETFLSFLQKYVDFCAQRAKIRFRRRGGSRL
nr:MAG TPA: hypothetical protein [Caudoviricetes sp.]